MAGWHRLSWALAGLILLGSVAFSPQSWGEEHENIGVVLAVQGTAEVRTPSKSDWETLRFRDHIFLEETIRTHANGKVKLLLRNDSIMTLSENSEIHVTEFLLNDQQHRSIISLVVGKVRILTTKLFGRADAMEVKTPNAVAGIRSSEKHVEYDGQTDRTTVFCVSGHCYIRHHHDPDKHLRIPEGHITDHHGSKFPSVTRRISQHEHHRSASDLSLTTHDPRALNMEPESPEGAERPPRRAPHPPRDDNGEPPPSMQGG
ncbi:FecR family protein, partial [Candidatus Entotheonella palauensis]|uniref:FecR family protein n=1 Tax=Candidatus Entotheonella palauensis TaxID=93172 RepID=UPI0011775627